MALTDSGIAGLLDELIEAVIDAYMWDEGMTGGCAEGEFRAQFALSQKGSTTTGFPIALDVTYPGGTWIDHEGGSELDSGFQHPFDAKEIYDRVDAAVRAAFSPWLELPEPGDFDSLIHAASAAAQALRAGGAYLVTGAAGGKDQPEGSELKVGIGNPALDNYLERVEHRLGNLHGSTVKALWDNYVLWMRDTIAGQHVMAVVLDAALTGEKEVWTRTRKGLPDMVKEATKAFHDYSNGAGQHADLGKFLNVVGTITAVAGLVVTGGASTAVAATGTIASVLGQFLPDQPEAEPSILEGGSADEMLSSLFGILGNLDRQIHDTEGAFQVCLINASAHLTDHPGAYDVKAARGLRPFLKERDHDDLYLAGEEINIVNSDLRDTAIGFELIAEVQGNQAIRVRSALRTGPWSRSSLGLGPVGHHPQYQDLGQSLAALLENSQTELKDAAARIILVINDFDIAETQITSRLENMARKVKADVRFQLRKR